MNLLSYQPVDTSTFNFGEFLCRRLLEKMGHEVNHYTSVQRPKRRVDQMLFAIGGMLNSRYLDMVADKVDGKIDVWGSGLDASYRPEFVLKSLEKFNVHMVRGPLTRDEYKLNVPLGDPGFLTSMFWNPKPVSSGEIVFVNFYCDQGVKPPEGTTKVVETLLSGTYEEMCEQLDNAIAEIASARFVFSSSMHGAIVAHSFGVPWAIAPKKGKDIAKEWKWHDICLSLNGRQDKIVSSKDFVVGKKWWLKEGKNLKKITHKYQMEILGALPYDK